MFVFKVDGLDDIDELIKKLGKLPTKDTNEILDQAAGVLLNRIRTRFLAEELASGGKFQQTKAGLARKAKGDTGVLFDTGSLWQSISIFRRYKTTRWVGVDPRATNTRTGKKVEEYAREYQEGTGPYHIPFLDYNDNDVQMVEKTLHMLFERKIRKL